MIIYMLRETTPPGISEVQSKNLPLPSWSICCREVAFNVSARRVSQCDFCLTKTLACFPEPVYAHPSLARQALL